MQYKTVTAFDALTKIVILSWEIYWLDCVFRGTSITLRFLNKIQTTQSFKKETDEYSLASESIERFSLLLFLQGFILHILADFRITTFITLLLWQDC